MAGKRVSALDVAKKAGVSRTTVSFVLNNTPGKHITEETRQKVLKAAAELNYIPNKEARNLAMIRHHSIGLFICHSQSMFSDAYITRVIEGMAPILNKNRFQLVLQPLKLRQANYLQLAENDRVDGVIILNTYDNDKGLSGISESGFPLVVIGTIANKDIPQVDIDNRKAASEVVNYLVELGHTRIAMIVHAPLIYYAARERLEGYKQSLNEAGIEYIMEFVREADFSEKSGYKAMQEILALPDKPSAVFAGNDIIAYGVIQAIKDAGLSIPEDISIAGFDDDFLSRYLNPPLTTMTLPAAGLAEVAVKLLISKLNRKINHKLQQILLPTHLSIRKTCRRV